MKRPSNTRLSFSAARELRRNLEETAARNDRSVAEEIQARLMATFNMQEMATGVAGDHLLLLRLDGGLAAWLKAYQKSWSLAGDLNATTVFLLRCQMQEATKTDHVYAAVAEQLPEPWRSHVTKSRKYLDYVNRGRHA